MTTQLPVVVVYKHVMLSFPAPPMHELELGQVSPLHEQAPFGDGGRSSQVVPASTREDDNKLSRPIIINLRDWRLKVFILGFLCLNLVRAVIRTSLGSVRSAKREQ